MQHLANRLRVSRSTVSRALRDDPQISYATRQRIKAFASSVGYHPNALAQALHRRRAGAIGLLLPRSSQFVFANPYFSELLLGLSDVAEGAGYPLVVSTSKVPNYESWLKEARVDGLITLGSSVMEADIATINDLVASGYPFVCLHAGPPGLEATTISSDEASGIRSALEHLSDLGHRSIAFLAGPQDARYATTRAAAYRRAAAMIGLEESETLLRHGDDTYESGGERVRQLLAQGNGFTAVLANNDLIALGAVEVLQDGGLAVPEHVSVVGFDDVPPARLAKPALTTVRQPIRDLGRLAMKSALRLMAGKVAPSAQLPVELLVRSSTGPAPIPRTLDAGTYGEGGAVLKNRQP